MRFVSCFFLIAGVLALADLAAASPRDDLTQKITQLKAKPNDTALREAIIKLAQETKPAPAIPEEARQKFVEGNTIAKSAKGPSGQKLAIKRYQEALLIAPWWGDAYFNLATAQELAGKFDDAKTSLKLYILTNPGEKEARDAQDRIYALNAKADLARAKKEDAGRARLAAPQPPAPAPPPAASAESKRWNAHWTFAWSNSDGSGSDPGGLQSTQIGNVIEFRSSGSMVALRGTISGSGSIAWEKNDGLCGMRPVSVSVSPDFNTLRYSFNSFDGSTCGYFSDISTVTMTRQ